MGPPMSVKRSQNINLQSITSNLVFIRFLIFAVKFHCFQSVNASVSQAYVKWLLIPKNGNTVKLSYNELNHNKHSVIMNIIFNPK
jgi:hypothetical protein